MRAETEVGKHLHYFPPFILGDKRLYQAAQDWVTPWAGCQALRRIFTCCSPFKDAKYCTFLDCVSKATHHEEVGFEPPALEL